MAKKVLNVGQCGFDHRRIEHYLTANFDVEIKQAHTHQEALAQLKEQSFDLVLINRLLDTDQSPGMDVLNSIKSNSDTGNVPVMVVSNYEDAQAKAIDAGAVKGFGKANLDRPETFELLGEFLR